LGAADVALRQGGNLVPFVLIASVGANLFLAGWILGDRSSFALRGPPPPGPFAEHVTDALSPQGAEIMRTTFDKMRERFEANFDEVRAEHARKDKLLSATSFDKAAFLAELKTERDERADDEAEANEIFSDGIAQLSLEDRHKLAALRLPPHLGGGPPPPFR
jgi:uncharacterized membrane protein